MKFIIRKTKFSTKPLTKLMAGEIQIGEANKLLEPVNTQSDYEIEVRLGNFTTRFIPGVTSKEFYRMLNYFSENFELVTDPITETTSKFLNKPLSNNPQLFYDKIYSETKETFVPKTDSFAPIFVVKKERIDDVDFPSFFTRLSKSKETLIETVTDRSKILERLKNDPNLIRFKKRWSFITRENSNPLYKFRIDLTHVTSTNVKESIISVSYEIEMELISPPLNSFKEDVYPAIKKLISIKQDSQFPVFAETVASVIQGYNRLFKDDFEFQRNPDKDRLFDSVLKPTNLKLNSLIYPEKLSITDKADGTRKFLFTRKDGSFMVYPQFDVSKFSKKTDYINSLFDGELIINKDKSQKYLIFDILFLNEVDLREQNFMSRLKVLKQLDLSKLDEFQRISLKEFYLPPENFYIRVNRLMDSIPSKNYGNDGLVLNDIDSVYLEKRRDNRRKKIYGKVYKWKPPHLLTIDFKIQTTGSPNEFYLYARDENTKELVRFQNFKITDKDLENNQIVEFRFSDKTNSWEKLKIRTDRDFPNNLSTVEDIWRDIQDPILEETIRGLDLKAMRKIHNNVKRDLLSTTGPRLLDIGSGKGGDIGKWIDTKKTDVLAIEPNNDNITELYSRLISRGFVKKDDVYLFSDKLNVKVLNVGGEDTETIVKSLEKKVDCLSILNALTFFFESEEYLNKLLNTVSKTLKIGGDLIGIVMDSDQVLKLFNYYKNLGERLNTLLLNELWNIDTNSVVEKAKKDEIVKNKMVSLSSRFLDTVIQNLESIKNNYISYSGWSIKLISSSSEFGNKIIINIEDSIVTDQTEYLVNFKLLQRKFGEVGLELVEDYLLDYPNRLSFSQNALSSLYRTFKFKRVKDLGITVPFVLPVPIKEPEKESAEVDSVSELIKEFKIVQNPGIPNIDPPIFVSIEKKKIVNVCEELYKQGFICDIDLLLKQAKNKWKTDKRLKRLHSRYPKFKDAEKFIKDSRNWRPLKLYGFVAQEFNIGLQINDSFYGDPNSSKQFKL